jgi:hypothetical protein
MKKFFLNFIILLSVTTFSVQAQCEEAVRKAVLQEMGDAQYIKDFSITLEKGVNQSTTGMVKFNVLLNSRNHYKFNVANGASNPDDIIMQLYDKDKLLSSNLDGGKKYKGFEFICRATKVYQLVFSFTGGEEGCAEAVLSLVKQYSEGEMGF